MATRQLVTKVWIAPGCIVCDACETTCPDVFQVLESTCIIRPEALTPDFTRPRTQTIIEASEECPVEVIKFETVAVEVPDEPEVPAAPVAEPALAVAAADPVGSTDTSAIPRPSTAAAAAAQAPAVSTDPALAAMLKATTARGGKAAQQGAASVPPAVKALRNRKIDELPPDGRFEKVLEAAKAEKSEPKVSRRTAVGAAGVGFLALAGATAAGGVVLQRFMMPNALEEADPRVRIGDLSKFMEMAVGQVNEDYKPLGISIVRLKSEIAALSTTCTHLGCIPNWQEGKHKFKCPCHGSGFMQSGINFEGPAPRPLERYQIAIEDGMVVVNKAKKFQQEKGEWANPDSFISV